MEINRKRIGIVYFVIWAFSSYISGPSQASFGRGYHLPEIVSLSDVIGVINITDIIESKRTDSDVLFIDSRETVEAVFKWKRIEHQFPAEVVDTSANYRLVFEHQGSSSIVPGLYYAFLEWCDEGVLTLAGDSRFTLFKLGAESEVKMPHRWCKHSLYSVSSTDSVCSEKVFSEMVKKCLISDQKQDFRVQLVHVTASSKQAKIRDGYCPIEFKSIDCPAELLPERKRFSYSCGGYVEYVRLDKDKLWSTLGGSNCGEKGCYVISGKWVSGAFVVSDIIDNTYLGISVLLPVPSENKANRSSNSGEKTEK